MWREVMNASLFCPAAIPFRPSRTLSRSTMPIARAEIEAAHARIAPHVRRTPVWTLPGAFGHHGPVSLKLEFLQHAGSFKTRGAFNTLLSRPVPAAGGAAGPGGNHAV